MTPLELLEKTFEDSGSILSEVHYSCLAEFAAHLARHPTEIQFLAFLYERSQADVNEDEELDVNEDEEPSVNEEKELKGYFGTVVCANPNCASEGDITVCLKKTSLIEDGGKARGFGSLDAYSEHILLHHSSTSNSSILLSQNPMCQPSPPSSPEPAPPLLPLPDRQFAPLPQLRQSRSPSKSPSKQRRPPSDDRTNGIYFDQAPSTSKNVYNCRPSHSTNSHSSTCGQVAVSMHPETEAQDDRMDIDLESPLTASPSKEEYRRRRNVEKLTNLVPTSFGQLLPLLKTSALSNRMELDVEHESIPAGAGGCEKALLEIEKFSEFGEGLLGGEIFDPDVPGAVDAARALLGLTSRDSLLPLLSISLMPHQIIGVAWMKSQELSKYRGGILADDMGLGKTIQTIGLLCANKSRKPERKSTLIIAPYAMLEQWKTEIEAKTKKDSFSVFVYHGPERKKVKLEQLKAYDVVVTTYGTLRAEDPSNSQQGKREIREKDSRKTERMSDADRSVGSRGLLYSVPWHRVVLDEAHTIRNRKLKALASVVALDSEVRWCLTGTPIINSLEDLFALFRFIQLPRWNTWDLFKRRVVGIEQRGKTAKSVSESQRLLEEAGVRAREILLSCMLRREKTSHIDGVPILNLPEKRIELVKLEFTAEERQRYDLYERESRTKLKNMIRNNTAGANYTQILVMIMRLRQLCLHPSLTGGIGATDQVLGSSSLTTNDLEHAKEALGSELILKIEIARRQAADERFSADKRFSSDDVFDSDSDSKAGEPTQDRCGICTGDFLLSELGGVVTRCSHVFCRTCILDYLHESIEDETHANGPTNSPSAVAQSCPVCHERIDQENLFPLIMFESQGQDQGEAPTNVVSAVEGGAKKPKAKAKGAKSGDKLSLEPSPKMNYVLDYLKSLERQPSTATEKVIVISSLTSMLDLMESFLEKNNVNCCRYQGNMSTRDRRSALEKFKTNVKVKVLLLSLTSGGVGLTLTSANHVISLDLAWSYAIDSQAYDRAHRIGQTKPVFVKRLIVPGTIEERLLVLQDNKKQLTQSALTGGEASTGSTHRLEELAALFGLEPEEEN